MKDWKRLQELFERGSDLEPAARARFLGEQLDGDPDGRAALERLLAADALGDGRLDGSAADLFPDVVAGPDPEALCGETLAGYRVESLISSGGMGHVYRALRSAGGVEQRVALKVLRPGGDPERLVARFVRERETLARLEHENIVTFLDAGTLPDGRPFLAMQLVDGVPLPAWCEAQGLGAKERVRLFLCVLAGVQHAHRNLVLHRDLKPSNVLVTRQGVPKLLDFGVASVLEQGGATLVHPMPLTWDYASPEQRDGRALTTASDVYSLGVLLLETLTGAPPVPEPPPRPGDAPPRELRGDLEHIVARALEPDPAARYASVERLADDLERHLAGLPVSVRAANPVYRAQRFARRHAWPLAVVGALFLAVGAAWLGADVGRRRAEAEARLGWGAHAEAKVVSRILEEMLAEAARSDDAARRLLAFGERALREDVADLAEARALLRISLARLYLERDEPEKARAHLDAVLPMLDETRGLGRRDVERARSLRAALAQRP